MVRPNFAIVIPVMNQENHLDQCIASIFAQNVDSRISLHIQDGGSVDSTISIIEKWSAFSAQFPNISFSAESSPDNGIPEALNRGFSRMEGDFYTWLGADDFLFPWATAVMRSASRAFPEFEWFTGLPAHVNIETVPLALAGEAGISAPPTGYSRRMLAKGLMGGGLLTPMIQQEGTFWSDEAFRNIGKYISTEWTLAFDYDLWTRLALENTLLQLAVPLGAFRRSPFQLSAVQKVSYWKQARTIMQLANQSKKDNQRDFPKERAISNARHIAFYEPLERKWIYKRHRFRAFAILRSAQKIRMALRFPRR